MIGNVASGPDRAPVRVGLLGMYASANLGDTAIQQAVMGALRARHPDVEFVALCTAPEDAAATFGLRARHVSGFGPQVLPGVQAAAAEPSFCESLPLPLRLAAAAWQIDRHMRGLDMLLVSGSGQIDDYWGGPWEQPFRLRAWAGAARRQGKPVAFFGVGVDQLLTRSGAWLARSALALADLRVLRDEGSRQALRGLGLNAPCDVCPDPAFHLLPPVDERPHEGAGFAVISPIVRNAWPGARDSAYETYLQCLAALADHLLGKGLHVRFVCSQTRMDPPVIAEVRSRMRSDTARTSDYTPATVADYMQATRHASLVVASRLHALILAMVAGTPVVAASYARKVSQQMTDAGLARQCLDLDAVQPAALTAIVDEVLADLPRRREALARTVTAFRQQVDARLEALARLVPQGRSA